MCAAKRPQIAATTTRISAGLSATAAVAHCRNTIRQVGETEENAGMQSCDERGQQQREYIDSQLSMADGG